VSTLSVLTRRVSPGPGTAAVPDTLVVIVMRAPRTTPAIPTSRINRAT
jgi:hypothetical protein